MQEQNPIFEQAMRWIEALRSGAGERPAFFHWLAESPRHVEELGFALALSEEIAGLSLQQREQIENLARSQGHAPDATSTVVMLESTHPLASVAPARRDARKRIWLSVAAATLMAIAAGFALLQSGPERYTTEVGEQRTLQLADGSSVYLNADTRLEVRFSDELRELRLKQGEALFKVARDIKRPFRVRSDGITIQALGTQFNVRRHSSQTVVSVLEGSVRIANASTSPELQRKSQDTFTAGEEASIARGGQIEKRPVSDVANAIAWRQHRLIFQNDTLADIAAEFNRHNRSPRIRVEGAAARSRHFAGTFDADAPQALIEALQSDPTLLIRRTADEIIIASQ